MHKQAWKNLEIIHADHMLAEAEQRFSKEKDNDFISKKLSSIKIMIMSS